MEARFARSGRVVVATSAISLGRGPRDEIAAATAPAWSYQPHRREATA
jgi:hypothetical protein